MSTVKDEPFHLINSLPDRATWNEIIYAPTDRIKIGEGLKDVERGRTISHEVLKSQFPGKTTL